MAKPETSDAIMTPAQLKPLLLASKHEPVGCAVGMTRDKHGVILLDKRMKPRQVLAAARKAAASAGIELDAASLRFGRAMVDTDTDAGLVQFRVNKDAPAALRAKLIEQLKRAGFTRCELSVDDALEADDSPPPAAPKAEAPLQHLTGLVRQMVGLLATNPPGADAMKSAALAAQAALKAGDQDAAAKETATLARLLAAAAPARDTANAKLAALATEWSAAEAAAKHGVDAVRRELLALYGNDPAAAEMERDFQLHADQIFATLDGTLAKLLSAAGNAGSGDEAATAKFGLSRAVDQCLAFLASNPAVAAIDENPFIEVALRPSCEAVLHQVTRALA